MTCYLSMLCCIPQLCRSNGMTLAKLLWFAVWPSYKCNIQLSYAEFVLKTFLIHIIGLVCVMRTIYVGHNLNNNSITDRTTLWSDNSFILQIDNIQRHIFQPTYMFEPTLLNYFWNQKNHQISSNMWTLSLNYFIWERSKWIRNI